MAVESDNPATESVSAVDRIASILESRVDTPEKQAKPPEITAEDDESDPAIEAEESEPEEEGTDEDQDQEQPEAAKLEELEIDGKKYQVPPDLKPYILRQQDYTRKTQEVAEHKRAVDAQAQQVNQMAQQYMQGLQITQHVLQQMLPPPPPQQMWDEDPIEAMRQERAHQAAAQRIHAVRAEQNRAAQALQQRDDEALARAKNETRETLRKEIPGWHDEKKMRAELDELSSYLLENGFSQEELQFATDPRAIKLSRKARLYDQIIAQKKTATPIAPKVAQAAPSRIPADRSAEAKARASLSRTGGRNGEGAFLLGRLLEKRGFK